MKRTIGQRLRAAGRFIPGFRHRSSSSVAVALTYYAAALAVASASWPWGMALLATPFFIFALSGLGQGGGRRNMVTASVAAALMLLGVALGLGIEGYRLKSSAAPPVLTQKTGATAVNAGKPSAHPWPTETPTNVQVAEYVASKSGKVFHRPDCASAKNIKPTNRVQYATHAAAIAAGLKPCEKCKP